MEIEKKEEREREKQTDKNRERKQSEEGFVKLFRRFKIEEKQKKK